MAFGRFNISSLPMAQPTQQARMGVVPLVSPLVSPASAQRRCTVTACPSMVCYHPTSHGLCRKHYERAWRAKHSVSTEQTERCHVPCCERVVYYKAKSQHMCRPHYTEMRHLRAQRIQKTALLQRADLYSMSSSSSSSSTMSDDPSSSSSSSSNRHSRVSSEEPTTDLQDESVCFDEIYMDSAGSAQ